MENKLKIAVNNMIKAVNDSKEGVIDEHIDNELLTEEDDEPDIEPYLGIFPKPDKKHGY